jgi:hypothetical protein
MHPLGNRFGELCLVGGFVETVVSAFDEDGVGRVAL